MILNGPLNRHQILQICIVELLPNSFCCNVFSGRHRRALGVFFQISWRKAVCNTLCSYTCRQNHNLLNKRCSVPFGTVQQLQLVAIRATAQELAAPSDTESGCMLEWVLADHASQNAS